MAFTLKHAAKTMLLGGLGAAAVLAQTGRSLVQKGQSALDRHSPPGDPELPVDPAALSPDQRAALRRQLEQMDGAQGNG